MWIEEEVNVRECNCWGGSGSNGENSSGTSVHDDNIRRKMKGLREINSCVEVVSRKGKKVTVCENEIKDQANKVCE